MHSQNSGYLVDTDVRWDVREAASKDLKSKSHEMKTRPRKIGDAAVIAIIIGDKTANWS